MASYDGAFGAKTISFGQALFDSNKIGSSKIGTIREISTLEILGIFNCFIEIEARKTFGGWQPPRRPQRLYEALFG